LLCAKAAAFVSLGALVSIGSTLNSIALASPRLLFAMAADGHLPRFIGAMHRRFRTPMRREGRVDWLLEPRREGF
jgi:amino acid transporter